MEHNQGERRAGSAVRANLGENGQESGGEANGGPAPPLSDHLNRKTESESSPASNSQDGSMIPDAGERHDWAWEIDRSISSCCSEGHQLILEIVERLQTNQWTHSDIFGVHLSLTEAVVNAIKHGNHEDPAKRVYVTCRVSRSRCWIEIRDEGVGFNPENVPDCTLDENLDKPSGRGLRLMKNFMTHVQYHDCGKRLVMEKRLAS